MYYSNPTSGKTPSFENYNVTDFDDSVFYYHMSDKASSRKRKSELVYSTRNLPKANEAKPKKR